MKGGVAPHHEGVHDPWGKSGPAPCLWGTRGKLIGKKGGQTT